MILFLLFFTILAIMGKHIYELQQLNLNASVQQIQSPNSMVLQEKMRDKSPLIVHNLGNKYDIFQNISFENLIQQNPGYIINDNNKMISLDIFSKADSQLSIYKNENIIRDFKLQESLKDIFQPFHSNITCNEKYYLSMYKGKNAITLTQNKKNGLVLFQIDCKSSLYLLDPKHKEDILQKENNEIKKWAHKINLEPNLIVYVPPEWYYFYECDESSIISSIDYDTYFTYPYNLLR